MIRFLLPFLLVASITRAQVSHVVVDSVVIEGNKRTKDFVIFREMGISLGDSIPFEQLMPKLELAGRLLMNTGLFVNASCNICAWNGEKVVLKVIVREDWYIYPIPNIELADRNFNVWWVEQNRRLNRINFGLFLTMNNLTGRADLMKLNIQFGYTPKYELSYRLPYLTKKGNLGLNFNVLYSTNKEFQYNTIENKQRFFRDIENDDPMYSRFRIGAALNWRKGVFLNQEAGLTYHHNEVSDSIIVRNPDMFLDSAKVQRNLSLHYKISFDTRDVKPYPTKGIYAYLRIQKDGLGLASDVNLMSAYMGLGYYHAFSKKWHISLYAEGKKSFIYDRLPYFNQKAMGFGMSYVRGYQYYVMDAQDWAIFQSDIHFKLFEWRMKLKKFPIKAYREVPYRFFLRWHGDLGYSWDQSRYRDLYQNSLTNTLLAGTGLSLDMVVLFNVVLQLDYTFNLLGENGLYLRYKLKF